MNTRPPDLSDADVVAALHDGWEIAAQHIEYLAVGFGSHHWRAGDWFVTVHDLDHASWMSGEPFEGLERALTVSMRLADAGHDFVVAPLRAANGSVVNALASHFAISVYPFVDGSSTEDFTSDEDRDAVLRVVAALHGATPEVASVATVDDLALPDRAELERAIADVSGEWTDGPYAEPARHLLRDNLDHVRHALAAYDDFAVAARRARDTYVITHGEPHAANVMFTQGRPRLIDWDMTKIAPPERDIARIVTDIDEADAYGGSVDLDRLTLYALWWDLAEVGGYVAEFRRPHIRTADTDEAFHWLSHFVNLGEHYPGLLD